MFIIIYKSHEYDNIILIFTKDNKIKYFKLEKEYNFWIDFLFINDDDI